MPKCQIMSQFGGQEQTTTADILIYMVIVFLQVILLIWNLFLCVCLKDKLQRGEKKYLRGPNDFLPCL
jgi:hypothetical protein